MEGIRGRVQTPTQPKNIHGRRPGVGRFVRRASQEKVFGQARTEPARLLQETLQPGLAIGVTDGDALMVGRTRTQEREVPNISPSRADSPRRAAMTHMTAPSVQSDTARDRTSSALAMNKAWKPGAKSPRKNPLIASLLAMQPTVQQVPTYTGGTGANLAKVRRVPPRTPSPRPRVLLPRGDSPDYGDSSDLDMQGVLLHLRHKLKLDEVPTQRVPTETTFEQISGEEANENPNPPDRSEEEQEEEEEDEEEEFRNPFADVTCISDIAQPLWDARKSVSGPRTASMRHAQRLFGLKDAEGPPDAHGRQSFKRALTNIFSQRRGAHYGNTIRNMVYQAKEKKRRKLSDASRQQLLNKSRDMGMIRAIYNKARELRSKDTETPHTSSQKKLPARPSFFCPQGSETTGHKAMKQVVHATRQIRMEQKVQEVIKSISSAAAEENKQMEEEHLRKEREKEFWKKTQEQQRHFGKERRQAVQTGDAPAAVVKRRRSLTLKKASGLIEELVKEVFDDAPLSAIESPSRSVSSVTKDSVESDKAEASEDTKPEAETSEGTKSGDAQTEAPQRAGGSGLKTRLMRHVKQKKGKRNIFEIRRSLSAVKNILELHKETEEAFFRLQEIPANMVGAKFSDIMIAQAAVHDIRKTVTLWNEHLAHLKDCLNDVGIGKLPLCPEHHLMEIKALPEHQVELCDGCHSLMGEDVRSESKTEYMWWCRTCTETFMVCEKCGEARKADMAVQELHDLMPGMGDWDLAFAQATTAIMDAKANAADEPNEAEPIRNFIRQRSPRNLEGATSSSRRPSRRQSRQAADSLTRSSLQNKIPSRDKTLDTDSPRNSPRASRSSLDSSCTGTLNSSVDHSRFLQGVQDQGLNIMGLGAGSRPSFRVSVSHSPRKTSPGLGRYVNDLQNQEPQALLPVLYNMPFGQMTQSAPVSRDASPMGSRAGSPSRSEKSSRGMHLRHVMGYNRPFQKLFASASQDAQHPGILEYAGDSKQKRPAVFSMLERTPLGEAAASLDSQGHGNTDLTQFVLDQATASRGQTSRGGMPEQQNDDMVSQGAHEGDVQDPNQDSLGQHGNRDHLHQQHSMLQAEVFEVLRKTQGQAQPRGLLERVHCDASKALGQTYPHLLTGVRGSNAFHGQTAGIEAIEMGQHWSMMLASVRSSSECLSVQPVHRSKISVPSQWKFSHCGERFRTTVSAASGCDSADGAWEDSVHEPHELHDAFTEGGLHAVCSCLNDSCSKICATVDQEVLKRACAQASSTASGQLKSSSPDGGRHQHHRFRSAVGRPCSTPPMPTMLMRARTPRPQRPKSSCDIEDVCLQRWHVSLKPPRKALPFEKEADDSRRVRVRATAERRSTSVEEAEATARRLMPRLTAEFQGIAKTEENLETTVRPSVEDVEEQDGLVHQHSMEESSSRMSSYTPVAIYEAQALARHLLLPNLLRGTVPAVEDVSQRRATIGGIIQAAGPSPSLRSHTPLLAQGLMDLQIWHATAAAWGIRVSERAQGIQQAADPEETEESPQLQEAEGNASLHEEKTYLLDTALMSTAPPPENSPIATEKSAEFEQVVDGEILAVDLEIAATDIEASCYASHDSTAFMNKPEGTLDSRAADVVSSAAYLAPSPAEMEENSLPKDISRKSPSAAYPAPSPTEEESLPEDYSQGYNSSSGCYYSTEVQNGVAVLCRKSRDELEPANADKIELSQDKDEVLAADLEVAATDIGVTYDTDILTTILDAVTTANVAGVDGSRVLSELEVHGETPDLNEGRQPNGAPEPRHKSTQQADLGRWAADSPIHLPTPCGRRPRTGDHWTEQQRADKKYLRCFADLGYDFKSARVPFFQKGPLSDAPIKNPEVKPVPPPSRGSRRSRGPMARPLSIEQWGHSFQRYDQMPPD